MSNDIAVASLTTLPVTQKRVDLSSFAGENNFLPRIQLVGKGKYVDFLKITPGHYGVPSGDDIDDLGAEIDVLPLAVRNKALEMNGETPVSVFDDDSALFKDIAGRSSKPNSGCMFGPSVLVWERNTAKFYELFLGTKTAREEAPNLMPFMPVSENDAEEFGTEAKPPTACTLSSRYVQSKFNFHVPVIQACSVPITNLPNVAEIAAQVEKFVTESYDGPEVSTPETSRNR